MKGLNELCNRLGLPIGTLADSLEAQIRPYLEKLPLRLYSVIEMHYGLRLGGTCKTTKEIGEKLGISQSRAWQLNEKAIRELKRMGVGTEQKNLRSLKQKPILIKDVDFSVRVQTILEEIQIKTLEELARWSSSELLIHRKCGMKSLCEIKQVLAEHGLKLEENELSQEKTIAMETLDEMNNIELSLIRLLRIILLSDNYVIRTRAKNFVKDLKNILENLQPEIT